MAISVYKILMREHLNVIKSKLSGSPLLVQPRKGMAYGVVRQPYKVQRKLTNDSTSFGAGFCNLCRVFSLDELASLMVA